MSATDSKEDLPSKADDMELNSVSNHAAMPSSIEPTLDGNVDHLPPSKEAPSDPHDTPKNVNEESDKNVEETATILEKIEEIGAGDHNIDENLSPIESDESETPSPASSSAEVSKEPSEPLKPSSVEDVDSETQDDDLVLKWDDDDDEDPITLHPDRCEEKVSEEAVKETTNNVEKELLDEIDAQIADLDKNSQENKKDGSITEIDLCKSDDECEKVGNSSVTNIEEPIPSTDNDEQYSKEQTTVEESSKIVNIDIDSDNNATHTTSASQNIQTKSQEEFETELLNNPSEKEEDLVAPMHDNNSELLNDSDEIIQLLSPEAESKDAPHSATDGEDVLLGIEDNNTQIVEKKGGKAKEEVTTEGMDVDTSTPKDIETNQIQEENVPTVSTITITDSDKSIMEVDDIPLDTTQEEELLEQDTSTDIEPRDHGLKGTDAMIEIPTQELINLSNLSDSSSISVTDVSATEPIPEESSKEEPTDAQKATTAEDSVTITVEAKETGTSLKRDNELKSAFRTLVDPAGTAEDELLEDNGTEDKTIQDNITEGDNQQEKAEDEMAEVDNREDKTVVDNTEDEIHTEHVAVEVFHPKIRVKSLSSMLNEPSKSFEAVESAKKGVREKRISIEITSAEGSIVIGPSVAKDDNIPSEDSVMLDDAKPSTSQMAPDSSEDVGEATDSLGLLAESSRVRDDDEEQETSEHDDDDDDFDPDDESSNQMAADQSEDSAQHSEVDMPKSHPATEGTQDSNNAQDVPVTDSITVKDTLTHDSDADNNLTATNQDSNESAAPAEVNVTEGLENVQIKDIETSTQIESNENEMSFEIGNAANEEKENDGEIDIDDDIVCEEVEVTTENIGDDVMGQTVSTGLPETEKVVEVPQSSDQPMEVDTVKILDNSDEEVPPRSSKDSASDLTKESPTQPTKPDAQQSPSKLKKLEIAKPRHVVNIVDLEESSSEDDIQFQVVQKPPSTPESKVAPPEASNQIKVTSSGTPEANAAPKTTPVTAKCPSTSEATEAATQPAPLTDKKSYKDGAVATTSLEVFNLDSDEEETAAKAPTPPPPAKDKPPLKCINNSCASDASEPLHRADCSTIAYYNSNTKKNCVVCGPCAYAVCERAQRLVEGIKNLTPLLELEMGRSSQELVEISDSESEDEVEFDDEKSDGIGEEKARMLERQLADMINATWAKFKMDARLKETEAQLALDLDKLEKESEEVDKMLNECQLATDQLRCELYTTFESERQELQAINIVDTPDASYSVLEPFEKAISDSIQPKRRLSSACEIAAKRPAIPPAATDDKPDSHTKAEETKAIPLPDSSKDDDKDVSVVKLSAEAAPASLPPPGELQRPPVHPGMTVFAMKNAFGSWLKAKIVECTPKGGGQQFTMCRVRFDGKSARSLYKMLPARCLAYSDPANARMTIGTRVIALFKEVSAEKMMKRESFYSGIVAEVPNPVNKYRYLVFFDDGYAQYVQHADTRLVCEFSTLVWEEVHPFSREFVREYLLAYPERPMVRLHTGQSLKTEWNGKWWVSQVVQVDASLVQVYFEQDKRTEWIYRGSTRLAPLYLELQAAEKHRARPMPRNRMQTRVNMPYVEYTRSDEPETAKAESQIKEQQEEIRRQRAVAKKSTTATAPPPPAANLDGLTSRVVYYTPKNAVRPHKMVPHTCTPACKRNDVLALSELRTYNPLAKPLLSAWERQIVRFKGHKEVMYRAPCGRRLRSMQELHRYLRAVHSDMGVDLFDFGPNTHCLAEFVLNKCIVGKKDLSHGKENVPVPCVNYYDDSLPEFCSYNTERTPTAGVPLNLDPEFLCGCDCIDDCQDKTKCACWKMTLEGARTIGLEGPNVGYSYKRLPEPLPSGIYECNSRCKCKSTCLNRVAQHPLQLKLQVFKTVNRGWGIRALNDVPKGAFLCIYAGNLLTDATANLDGLNEGDEYLAELDYIEVVEQMKEGYEDDIPEQDKKLDKKELGKKTETESEPTTEEEEDGPSKDEKDDFDFRPVGYVEPGPTAFSKRLRKREKAKIKKEKEEQQKKDAKENAEDDCITISDDEELREPARFAAQAGMGAEFVSKYRSLRSYFGKDEACYIMDAKVQGNIGRYLNHSCSPNVFVQNVFVDTHDPRFPWVAFFALSHIRAGTELTWNYNYDVGSVPGKALYCYCGAPNCRGRLL